jgi:predicted XRE-type DNA-binding protein
MKKSSAQKHSIEAVRRTGNVYAQLGLPNAGERLRKARLMNVINDVIQRRELTQAQVSELTGLNQADVSRLAHGQGTRFSLSRLLDVIARMGVDIEMIQRRDPKGHLVVEVHELNQA